MIEIFHKLSCMALMISRIVSIEIKVKMSNLIKLSLVMIVFMIKEMEVNSIMRIEDYWIDCTSYFVEFIGGNSKKIEKIIILPCNLTKIEVENIILSSFNKIEKIISIDDMDDGMIYKGGISMFFRDEKSQDRLTSEKVV